jgi:hypothetical protein
MTYSDMFLVRSSPEKQRVAIGIRMTADEQMRRDYGPLKNSTGITAHKSTQNIEMRGSKSRPGLTVRDIDLDPKRMKANNHFWTNNEKQTLVDIAASTAENLSKETIDWRRVYSLLSEKYDWVEFMEIAAVKSIYYQHIKISRNASSATTSSTISSVHGMHSSRERTSMTSSTISSNVSDVYYSVNSMGDNDEHEEDRTISTSRSTSIIVLEDKGNGTRVVTTEATSASAPHRNTREKEYQLIFSRKDFSWAEIQSVLLQPAEKQQKFSENEDKILLHLTSHKKYKTGNSKTTFDWSHIHRDFLDWCKYFTLHSFGKCTFFVREQQSLRDRFKNLNREDRNN